MQSFVYAWQDKGTFPNKWYIGRKLGDYYQIDSANTYQSTCKPLAEQMKFRPNDFQRILLMGFEDRVSHIKLEAELLQAVDAAHNPLYYNQHNEDGKWHTLGRKHTEEWKRKQSERLKGNKHSSGREPWNKGKIGLIKQSLESVAKRVIANTGKKRTEEQKKRMGEAQKRCGNVPPSRLGCRKVKVNESLY